MRGGEVRRERPLIGAAVPGAGEGPARVLFKPVRARALVYRDVSLERRDPLGATTYALTS